jgi:hypothetical protein
MVGGGGGGIVAVIRRKDNQVLFAHGRPAARGRTWSSSRSPLVETRRVVSGVPRPGRTRSTLANREAALHVAQSRSRIIRLRPSALVAVCTLVMWRPAKRSSTFPMPSRGICRSCK